MGQSFLRQKYSIKLACCSEDGLIKLLICTFMQGVSSKFGVKAMPTFFLIKGKEVVKKIVGANPDEVKKMVDSSAESLGSAITSPPDIVIE